MAKHVLYLVGRYPCRTETFIEREIDGLGRRGFEIKVVPLFDIKLLESFQVIPRYMNAFTKISRQLRTQQITSWRRITSSFLRSLPIVPMTREYDHIHAHFLGLPATVAYMLSVLTDIPYSLSAHARDIYVELTHPTVINTARFRTTCTETNRLYLNNRYDNAPFQLIRHGLDPEQYLKTRHYTMGGNCRLLAVARFVEKKGLINLVLACDRLQRKRFPFTCTIIGEGPQASHLSHTIDRLDMKESIQLRPPCDHVQIIEQYRQSDILVVPSVIAQDGDRDGVPNVILEAIAAGCPVVATDAGSIPEVVKDAVTGVVVPQNDPQALAGAIERLWTDVEKRRCLSGRALEMLRTEYDPEKWFDGLCDLFAAI